MLHIVVLDHSAIITQPKDLEFINSGEGWFDIEAFPRLIGTFNIHHPDTVDKIRAALFKECYDCEVEVKYARGS